MTQDPNAALSVAMAYYRAWTGKDVDGAMTHVADDVAWETPLGPVQEVEGLRRFMAPFAQTLTGADLLAAFGDQETAVLLYNPHTTLVQDAPSAEWFTVEDGRIVRGLLIFDRTPFDAARRAAT